MYVKPWVAPRKFREYRRQNCRAEGERCGDPQAPAQVAGGQNGLSRNIDLGADPGGVIAESHASLGQRGATGGPRNKLNAEVRFQAEQAPTYDGLGDTEPTSGRRYAAGIGDFDKCLQVFNIQLVFRFLRHSVSNGKPTTSV